jgi:hypothetical protein
MPDWFQEPCQFSGLAEISGKIVGGALVEAIGRRTVGEFRQLA